MQSPEFRYRAVAAKPEVATATEPSQISEPPGPLSRPYATHQDHGYWPTIASKDDIPLWLRDNDYLILGHPMPTSSYRRSYRLWRCLHMEFMNIWTHIIGSAGFAVAGFLLLGFAREAHWNDVPSGDAFAFGIFFTSCTIAFGLSANFHTLRSHSYRVHHLWGRMDILGICLLAYGGGFSATYYTFYSNPTVRYVYWGVNAGAAVAAAATLLDTGGGGSKMRTLRGGVFSALTLSAMIPIIHRSIQLGWDEACRQIGAQYFAAEGAALVLGVCLFVGRAPECFRPGAFDIWGHSHQLWHICAVIGMAFHGMALGCGYRFLHGDA